MVQALHGISGVGKTQLAAEYAHRFARTYELVWWIDCERPELIGDQFAALGTALGCLQLGAGIDAVRAEVFRELRVRDRWLLVFDNAEIPSGVRGWLPAGNGHVLITSRERGWTEVAASVEIDVLARAESVAILCDRVTGLSGTDADRLAADLGDLPLAVAQAAAFMASSAMSAGQYSQLLKTRAREILAQGSPVSYPRSLAAAIQLTADQLARDDPAAADLANVCSFLGPEPIPEDLLISASRKLPSSVAARAADTLAWRQTLAQMTRQSLARIDYRGLQMHRLTQAILRDRLTPEHAATARSQAEAVLVASYPGDGDDPSTWPLWARLMPHLLAADLASTGNPALRWLACAASRYLLARGNARSSHDLASRLYQQWRGRWGDDNPLILETAYYLAQALRDTGSFAEALELDQDTLARCRRIMGDEHSNTFSSATSVALDLYRLGDFQAARNLAQDTLNRERRVLGWDHPNTLASANNLSLDLRALGDEQAARDLDQDTLNRRRRVLGHNHPDTLTSASGLALSLRALGDVQAARDLDQDTLTRRLQVLGENHPHTLASANNLARDLAALGDVQAARDLDQDTLTRRLQVLGENHPDTLASAENLAADLAALGEA